MPSQSCCLHLYFIAQATFGADAGDVRQRGGGVSLVSRRRCPRPYRRLRSLLWSVPLVPQGGEGGRLPQQPHVPSPSNSQVLLTIGWKTDLHLTFQDCYCEWAWRCPWISEGGRPSRAWQRRGDGKKKLFYRQDQPWEYRLTIYRYANIVWFSKYRWNIVIAYFFFHITQYF